MTYAKRVDVNQEAIVKVLRAIGWHVEVTSSAGKGFPDLVCAKGGRLELVEVKDGSKPPSARKLTPDEQAVHREFAARGCPVVILESVQDAVNL